MAKEKKKSKARKRKNEFPKGKRLYDLVKEDYHSELQLLVYKLRPWLIDGENVYWKNLKRIDIDYSKIKHSRRCKDKTRITKDEFFEPIAEFLFSIDRGRGLNVPLEAFVRYLASPKHSNFGMKSESLRTKIIKHLAYLESKKDMVGH